MHHRGVQGHHEVQGGCVEIDERYCGRAAFGRSPLPKEPLDPVTQRDETVEMRDEAGSSARLTNRPFMYRKPMKPQ